MLWNDQPVAYVVLADPEHETILSALPNLPPHESKIFCDSKLRPRLLLDVSAFEQYRAEIDSGSDPFSFDWIWKAVRKGDAAALREIPFLVSASEASKLMESGQLARETLEDGSGPAAPSVQTSAAPKSFRTGRKEMEDLAQDWEDTYRASFSNAHRLGLLDYLLRWDRHIPPDMPQDFYRGLCHGLRFALDTYLLLEDVDPNSSELRILQELYLYLAGRAAECCLRGYFGRPGILNSKRMIRVPDRIAAHVVPSFEVKTPDIEELAARVDKSLLEKIAPLRAAATRSPADPTTPLEPILEPGHSASFYKGVVYATTLNERIAAIYETDILPPELCQWTMLEQGARQTSCIAACHWIQAAYGPAN